VDKPTIPTAVLIDSVLTMATTSKEGTDHRRW